MIKVERNIISVMPVHKIHGIMVTTCKEKCHDFTDLPPKQKWYYPTLENGYLGLWRKHYHSAILNDVSFATKHNTV